MLLNAPSNIQFQQVEKMLVITVAVVAPPPITITVPAVATPVAMCRRWG